MKDKANWMKASTLKLNEVPYINSGASNHMTSHEDWLSYLEKPEQSGVIENGDDTAHTIEHVGKAPLNHVRQKGKLTNVVHVPTITKNLVSVGQIVDQGMEVWFTHLGCFIKEKGKVIAKGRRGGLASKRTKLKPLCLRKGKRSSRISTYGTRGLVMSTSCGFQKCRRRISFLDCRNLVAGMANSAKPVS